MVDMLGLFCKFGNLISTDYMLLICLLLSLLLVCRHPGVNITMLRCLHDFGDVIHVNYTVERTVQGRLPPISVDVYAEGLHEASTCENKSIPNRDGVVMVTITFQQGCMDPVVTINRTATVNLTLDLGVNVTFTDIDMLCDTITVGPQSEYSSCVQLLKGVIDTAIMRICML